MKLSLLKINLIALIAIMASGIVAAKSNVREANDVNVCYENLSKAYLSLDANKMVDVYVSGGHYISAGSRSDIVKGKSDLAKLYQSYFKRLKKHNSSLDLQFRVSDRLVDTNSISDIGYYVVTIIPPKESGQPAKQHAGKFMITFKAQKDGQWGIWSEANSKVKLKSYINAKRQGDLHYDPYFPISHYQDK